MDSLKANFLQLDQTDTLAKFRQEFFIPKNNLGDNTIYYCGNSLGLLSARAEKGVIQELEDWKKYGVEGHLQAENPNK